MLIHLIHSDEQFQLKLQYFGKKYGSNIHLVDESYTTKTCGGCGHINDAVGSAKHFTCSNCPYNLDRDIHGARNIWIRTVASIQQLKGSDSNPLESGH
jgi:putative transposase